VVLAFEDTEDTRKVRHCLISQEWQCREDIGNVHTREENHNYMGRSGVYASVIKICGSLDEHYL
jgi:hypothetical protein